MRQKAVRLTVGMRETIRDRLMDATVYAETKKARALKLAAGDRIYHLLMDKYADQIKDVPEIFFCTSKDIRIGAACGTSQEYAEPLPESEWVHTAESECRVDRITINLSEYLQVPACSLQGRMAFVIGKKQPLIVEYIRLENVLSEALRDTFEFKSKVDKALSSYTTVQKLAEGWGDIVEYIPKDFFEKDPVQLPAVNVDFVSEAIMKSKKSA